MDRFLSLSVFLAAVEGGSLAAAARGLGMTPAMAGKHLAAMEASLGVRLLHRTTRKLHLTEAGEHYYRHGRLILDQLDEADRAARALQEEPRGVLRLSAPSSFGALHLGPPVAEYMRRYPGVWVEMSLDDRFVDLLGGGFDCAIRIGSLPDSSLVALRLAESRMIACAAPAYLEAHGRPTSPADLRGHHRLAFSRATSPGDWTFTGPDGRAERVTGPPRLLADNMELLLAAALAGGGIAYGPSFVLGPHVARGALERILPGYTTESLAISLVYPSARQVSTKLRRFADVLKERFGPMPEGASAVASP
ncbi:LysR family transcriptional regulator [Acidisoma sp. 7E03]